MSRRVWTLEPHRAPPADKTETVTLEGATHTVAFDGDAETGAVWIEAIRLDGVWHGSEALGEHFCAALSAQLEAEFRAEREPAGMDEPAGLVAA